MPSEAAKKARTCEMKCCSVIKSLSQSTTLAERLISSAVQKEASAFLCILLDIVVLDGEEDKTMGVCLEEQLGGKIAFSFGILVTRDLLAHRWRFFHSFPGGQGVSGVMAELIPVVAILADEVRDLAEGLVGDVVFEGHGDGGN